MWWPLNRKYTVHRLADYVYIVDISIAIPHNSEVAQLYWGKCRNLVANMYADRFVLHMCFRLMAAIIDLPVTLSSESIYISPSVLLDAEHFAILYTN